MTAKNAEEACSEITELYRVNSGLDFKVPQEKTPFWQMADKSGPLDKEAEHQNVLNK
jgi:hypothetical protein